MGKYDTGIGGPFLDLFLFNLLPVSASHFLDLLSGLLLLQFFTIASLDAILLPEPEKQPKMPDNKAMISNLQAQKVVKRFSYQLCFCRYKRTCVFVLRNKPIAFPYMYIQREGRSQEQWRKVLERADSGPLLNSDMWDYRQLPEKVASV